MRSPASQEGTNGRPWFNWTLAGVATAALVAVALWLCIAVLPQHLYPPLSNADLAGLSPADQAARREGRDKLQNDARTTLLQGLAALLVLGGAGIGAAVTLRQVRIGREQLEQARQQGQRSDDRLREQIAVAQEGQITERFTRAVDQLGQPGPDRLDVRLGGIYALERIAHDSPTHRLAVVEILTAFIRGHAPWPPRLPGQYCADAPIDEVPSLQTRAPDVQAALTVIGRRPTQKDDPRLDLNETDLRRAELNDANLTKSEFAGANLTKAWLSRADLTESQFIKANLTEAWLAMANLTEAWLVDANMTKAWLTGADLTEAWLTRADLTEAHLIEANLTRARLDGANLTQTQLGKALTTNETTWPDGWDRMRRAAAGIQEPDEEAPPAASPPG
jgi:Pentapeptide repeats (8 copies)